MTLFEYEQPLAQDSLSDLSDVTGETAAEETQTEEPALELFQDDGHLTGAGLAALMDGTLDGMGRLEASEHLSFCDECLLRYTDLLTDGVLLAPKTPVAQNVTHTLRRRTLRAVQGRCARAAAAAVLALALWSAGVFTNLVPAREAPGSPEPVRAPFNASSYVNGLFRSAGDSITHTLSAWLGGELA